jgi:hypothetical protein
MSPQLVKDIAAGVIVLGGLFVAYLQIPKFFRYAAPSRWLHLIDAIAGLAMVVIFGMALLRLYPGGSDTIDPRAGRPVFILILASMSMRAIKDKISPGGS